jgi:hypothetical protein
MTNNGMICPKLEKKMKKILLILAVLAGSNAFADCNEYQVLKTTDTTGNNMVIKTNINSTYTNSDGELVIRFNSVTLSPSFTSTCKFIELDKEKIKAGKGPFAWDKKSEVELKRFENMANLATATGANLGFTIATDYSDNTHYIGSVTMSHGLSISPAGNSAERKPMNK